MELAQALAQLELTTLRVIRREDGYRVQVARDWDDDTPFADYPRAFVVDEAPRRSARAHGDQVAREELHRVGASEALAELERGMRAGGHEMIVLHVHTALDIRLCHFVHSSRLGHNNGFHALRAGGLRRHAPAESEAVVIADGLNLSRAMSFKNAAAGIPFGGSKTTVQTPPMDQPDPARLGFLAWCIDAGNLITGPDVGFPPELIDWLAERYTRHILGGPGGPLGHTGAPTALGVFTAIVEAARHVFGEHPLSHRRVAIQGLGSVGLELGKLLALQGVKLVVADTDPARIAHAHEEIGGLEVVSPEELPTTPCDVFAPCAMGGVLDAESIQKLDTRLVYGSANNQLAARSTSDELELAERIAARGILFQPDWSYTMGGVLLGYEEYVHRERASYDRVTQQIEHACRDGTRALLDEAARSGRTPSAIAYEHYGRLVYDEEPEIA